MSLFKEIISYLRCLLATSVMAVLMFLLAADGSKGNLNSLPPVSFFVFVAILGALFLWWDNRERRIANQNEHIQALTNRGRCKQCESADPVLEDLDWTIATVQCKKCGYSAKHWIPDV
jgi:hypothetical protein